MRAEFDCLGFTFGNEGLPNSPSGRYGVTVQIPWSPLIDVWSVETRSYLGTVRSKRKRRDGLRWQSTLGEFLMADFYHFEATRFHDDRLLARIKVAELRLEGKISSKVDPPSLVREVEAAIEEPLRLLSFLSRRNLVWYEIRADFILQERKNRQWPSYLKRRVVLLNNSQDVQPLADRWHLFAGGFDGLLVRLRNAGARDWLVKAMIYCVASYHEPTLETQISMIYLALESLAKAIRQGSLLEGLRALVQKPGITPEHIWPPKVDLGDATTKLVKRRNKFIHEARIENPELLVNDLGRLQALVERGILALLGCGPDWVDGFAYDTRWLTSAEA
jgi:hypothetical protein